MTASSPKKMLHFSEMKATGWSSNDIHFRFPGKCWHSVESFRKCRHFENSEETIRWKESDWLVSGVKLGGQTLAANNITAYQSTGGTYCHDDDDDDKRNGADCGQP